MQSDRRTFLTTAAGLAIGTRLAAASAQGANERIRVGIIGTGGRARGLMNQLKPDVAIVQTTPAKNGRVSLGIETNVVPAAIDATRANGGKVVGVVNPNMPYTFGDAEIDCTMFDAMFDMQFELPSAQPVTPQPGSVFEQIGGACR